MRGKIRLCYRKIITIESMSTWERLVFTDSFTAFKMQAQHYDQANKYQTFLQLMQNVPNANQLHFLVSGAVVGYVKQLNGIVPDVTNNLGLLFLTFDQFRFEIINSDLNNIDKHIVAINFYSDELNYLAQIDQYLLTSKANSTTENMGETLTDLFTISPYLSIYSIQQ